MLLAKSLKEPVSFFQQYCSFRPYNVTKKWTISLEFFKGFVYFQWLHWTHSITSLIAITKKVKICEKPNCLYLLNGRRPSKFTTLNFVDLRISFPKTNIVSFFRYYVSRLIKIVLNFCVWVKSYCMPEILFRVGVSAEMWYFTTKILLKATVSVSYKD